MWSSFVVNMWFVWSLAESVLHRHLLRSFGFDKNLHAAPLFFEQGKAPIRFRLSDEIGRASCRERVF